jgi:WD40 repeat protein
MVIDKSDTFVICGNTFGTIYIFIINQNNKSEWTLYKKIKDHYSEITSLSINENLNMFISCSRDGYCMIYTLPECKQINSFRITDNLFNENNNTDNSDKIYYPNISIISNSPLPLIIFYIESRNSLSVFSINGHFIKEEKIDFKINENSIKKFTDAQFKDYLLIYNSNKNCIEVYNIIDLKNVLSLPIIGHTFIDFIWNNDLDHILILVKYKGKNEEKNNEQISSKTTYKILVMRNPNCEIDWK